MMRKPFLANEPVMFIHERGRIEYYGANWGFPIPLESGTKGVAVEDVDESAHEPGLRYVVCALRDRFGVQHWLKTSREHLYRPGKDRMRVKAFLQQDADFSVDATVNVGAIGTVIDADASGVWLAFGSDTRLRLPVRAVEFVPDEP
jgi:hypothetical protein